MNIKEKNGQLVVGPNTPHSTLILFGIAMFVSMATILKFIVLDDNYALRTSANMGIGMIAFDLFIFTWFITHLSRHVSIDRTTKEIQTIHLLLMIQPLIRRHSLSDFQFLYIDQGSNQHGAVFHLNFMGMNQTMTVATTGSKSDSELSLKKISDYTGLPIKTSLI